MGSQSRIIVLDEETVAQIAAGEVIERPVSVVKELVENALDAGSTRINIEVKKGGQKLIRVTDNGCGMSPQELQLAVQRHATSKIRCSEDLWKITTLGFRGEALPSIAAVSRLEIISRTSDDLSGYRLYIEGGKICSLEAAASPPGTRVTVLDLFYNLPVRRQFQKTPSGELSRIADLVGRIALAFPEVAFCLQQEGKVIFKTPGSGRLQESIAALYGSQLAASLLEIEESAATSLIKIKGYISPPSWTWNNRQRQTFIVNHRYIQSSILSLMLEDAYRGRIPGKRYPIAVLHLELPPGQVDVNIHPSKMEIRFRNERAVYHALAEAVNRTLHQAQAVSSFWGSPPPPREVFMVRERETISTNDSPYASDSPYYNEQKENAYVQIRKPADFYEKAPSLFTEHSFPEAGRDVSHSLAARAAFSLDLCSPANLQPLGQILDDIYIAAAGPDGLYLIDQHAAHERILYEELLDSMQATQKTSQTLLFPEIIELAPAEKTILQKKQELFSELGFMLEEGEESAMVLQGVPSWCAATAKETLLDLLNWVIQELPSSNPPATEAIAAHLACRQARKAGEKMSREEIEALLSQLGRCSNPYSCPHGRPTIVKFSAQEISRRFLRSSQ